MWASFYVDNKHKEEGALVENPCLGCLAQKFSPPRMLSPLLPSDVVAAHIIADAKGGPHGEDRKEAWNFMPLCATCNTNMGTTNAVDWFHAKCSASGDYMPLFEMLFRLWRGRDLNIENAPPPPSRFLSARAERDRQSNGEQIHPALLTAQPAC